SGCTSLADAALTASTVSAICCIEGVSPTSLTATFSDGNHRVPTSNISATTNWGDGHTTSFTSADVSGSNGSYTVSGSHQYAEEGPYSITVAISDVGGSSTTDSGTTTVADAALTAGTVSASGGIEGVTPTSLTATFSDANHGA